MTKLNDGVSHLAFRWRRYAFGGLLLIIICFALVSRRSTIRDGTFLGIGPPTINNRGDVAFGGLIDVQQATPLGAITVVSKGQRTVIVREGDPTPIGGTFTTVGSVPPLLNDRGQVLFVAGASGKPTTGGLFPVSGGIFLYDNGQIRKIVTYGEPSPIGGVFLSAGSPAFNNTGTVVFNGIIDTDGDGNPNNQGLFGVSVAPGA
jgi:hypothetical protein